MPPVWSSVTLHTEDLVLCSGTLRRGITFNDRLGAASAGGFAAVSLWGRDYQAARAEGLSDHDMRSMLSDHGLTVAELDPVWWWTPGAAEIHMPPELDDEDIFRFKEVELFAIAEAMGARSLNAVDVFGGKWGMEEATASFAALCRRAAEHGLLVHLEFLPWSRFPDLETAWEVVREADEPNGGITLDVWHYFRGSPNDDLLRSIPGDRVLAVQLSDAPMQAEPNLLHAALHDRLLPGEGELDLAEVIAGLSSVGATCPIGVEVFSDALDRLPPSEAARLAGNSMRMTLGRM